MREKVISEIQDFDQVLLSTADLALIDKKVVQNARFFSINNGSINQDWSIYQVQMFHEENLPQYPSHFD